MTNRKYHWAIQVVPSMHPHAWRAHAGGYYAQACGRRKKSVVGYPAERFVAKSQRNPDWYCSDCARAARLALAKESAPKPADVVWPKPRPISEAPKDGTPVLAYWSEQEYPRLRDLRWGIAKYGSGLVWFNAKRFGSRLAAVMARRKVSHRALADYCGVSPRSISNWVAGHKPPLPILRLLGTWWDLATVDYLTGASDVMPEPVRTEEG